MLNQLPLLNFDLHHFQMLKMCIWNLVTNCQMLMFHNLWLKDFTIACLYVGDYLLLMIAYMWIW